MYPLVIFDLDGTLLDTIQDLGNAGNYALKQGGYPQHEIEAYKHFVGSGIYKLVERSLPAEARDKEEILRVKALFDTYYREHSEDRTEPYEGILALLHNLKDKGKVCVVLTNKAEVYAKELVNKYFGGLIDCVIGQREGRATKPDPNGIIELLDQYNCMAEQCIYIGDSDIDMYTAKNAGVTSVGVLWGFRTEEELLASGAHYIAEDPLSLEKLIG